MQRAKKEFLSDIYYFDVVINMYNGPIQLVNVFPNYLRKL